MLTKAIPWVKRSIFLFLTHTSYGQDILYEKDSIDMGIVSIEDTLQARYYFHVLRDSIKIEKITTECTCILIKNPRGWLYKKEKKMIELSFLPYKYGNFDRNVIVHWENKKKDTLKLTGYIDAEEHFIERKYPIKNTYIQLKNKSLTIKYLVNKKTFSKEFHIYNNSPYILQFSEKTLFPPYIDILDFHTLRFEAKKSKKFHFIFNLSTHHLPIGFLQDTIVMAFQKEGKKEPVLETLSLPIKSAVLSETSFSGEIENSYTEIYIKNPVIKLGRLSGVEGKKISFYITNKGKRTLEIYHVEEEIGIELDQPISPILPKETKKITVKLKKTPRKGTQIRSIGIFSNALNMPFLKLSVVFYVKK